MKLATIVCFVCLTLYTFQCSCSARVIRKSYEGTVSTPKFNISAADLEYGKNEVRRILQDRPQMGQLVKEGDTIFTFTARGFAGELAAERLRWNPKENFLVGSNAFHFWRTPVIEICVNGHNNKGELRSAQECWANLIFEIYNSSRRKELIRLQEKAISCICSRKEYIERSAKPEYLAELQLFAFYKTTWKPRVEALKCKAGAPVMWGSCDAAVTFDEWLEGWRRREGLIGYPYGFFGERYDRLIARHKKGLR